MTYQPGSHKVDGYGYVKVKPQSLLTDSSKLFPRTFQGQFTHGKVAQGWDGTQK